VQFVELRGFEKADDSFDIVVRNAHEGLFRECSGRNTHAVRSTVGEGRSSRRACQEGFKPPADRQVAKLQEVLLRLLMVVSEIVDVVVL
jgi:hypothetical protein